MAISRRRVGVLVSAVALVFLFSPAAHAWNAQVKKAADADLRRVEVAAKRFKDISEKIASLREEKKTVSEDMERDQQAAWQTYQDVSEAVREGLENRQNKLKSDPRSGKGVRNYQKYINHIDQFDAEVEAMAVSDQGEREPTEAEVLAWIREVQGESGSQQELKELDENMADLGVSVDRYQGQYDGDGVTFSDTVGVEVEERDPETETLTAEYEGMMAKGWNKHKEEALQNDVADFNKFEVEFQRLANMIRRHQDAGEAVPQEVMEEMDDIMLGLGITHQAAVGKLSPAQKKYDETDDHETASRLQQEINALNRRMLVAVTIGVKIGALPEK